jgi:hypothetical protein
MDSEDYNSTFSEKLKMYLNIYEQKDKTIVYICLFDASERGNEFRYEGKTEKYVNSLEFKEGQELDIDEEWSKYIQVFFNNYVEGDNFYDNVEENGDHMDCYFTASDLIYMLKEIREIYGDDDALGIDEETTWNNIAYYRASQEFKIKEFVMEKIKERYDDFWEKDDVNNRLKCDICFENKKINAYTPCCVNKKICGLCWKKIQYNPCPFCRGRMNNGSEFLTNKKPKICLYEVVGQIIKKRSRRKNRGNIVV